MFRLPLSKEFVMKQIKVVVVLDVRDDGDSDPEGWIAQAIRSQMFPEEQIVSVKLTPQE
jgi:hypothetical protein